MGIVKQWLGTCVNFQGGNNKWWRIELHDNGEVWSYNGKIVNGAYDKGAQRLLGNGEALYNSKIREKQNKSDPKERYTEADIISGVQGTSKLVTSSTNLMDIARRQIESTSPMASRLIDRLVSANVHNITSQTTLKFNKVSGLFETPLGVVSADGLSKARTLLVDINDRVSARDFSTGTLDVIERYLGIIPKDLGRITRFKAEDLFPNLKAVQDQNDILDSLAASLQLVMQASANPTDTGPAPAEERIFQVQLELVEAPAEIQRVKTAFDSTRQAIHQASRYNVHQVWRVIHGNMNDAFETKGRAVGNIKELWHGTKIGNLLSILKSGFMIPDASAAHCCGRMFGNGLYFSDQSTKSLNYASGYAPGQRGGYSNECFMFLNLVAMGKEFMPRSNSECRYWNKAQNGYDSVFARGGYCNVSNNEMIVYETYQANPYYLVEFK